MKRSTWLLCASLSAVLATACSSSSGSGSGTGGSGGSKSTTTTTTTTTGTGGGSTDITNGCTEAMATDDTSMTAVTINFGGSTLGLKYSPACVKVKTGTMVTFAGDFMTHPLSGGVSGTKDATSPITETKTGMSATFTMSTAGTFGYFCEAHQSLGMQGAIYVQ